jgi:hypothetical protein
MLITAAEAIALNSKLTGKETQLNILIPIIQNKISQICNKKFLHVDQLTDRTIDPDIYIQYYVDFMNAWGDGWYFVNTTRTISNANIDFSTNFSDGDEIYISSPRNSGFYTIGIIAADGHSFSLKNVYDIKNESNVGGSIYLVDWPTDLKLNAVEMLTYEIFKNDVTAGMSSESLSGYSYSKSQIIQGYPEEIINALPVRPRFV